jgi:hypothetical protein
MGPAILWFSGVTVYPCSKEAGSSACFQKLLEEASEDRLKREPQGELPLRYPARKRLPGEPFSPDGYGYQ